MSLLTRKTGTYRALGLMSGTSMDGIDVALLETDGNNFVLRGQSGFYSYDDEFRESLLLGLEHAKHISCRSQRPESLADLERELTLRHAMAVDGFLKQNGLAATDIDVIGFHGQTVLHRPEHALTVQLGDGALLAQETGCTVVYDMRANDMRFGGQGAPLIPAYHQALAAQINNDVSDHSGTVIFVNIGGISNVTILEQGKAPLAFDTGPGNALLDQWVARHLNITYDADGAVAAKGSVIQPVLERYLAQGYFSKDLPKSLDRSDFTLELVEGLSLEDGARTLAKLSAVAVLTASNYTNGNPALWIICGGGRKNKIIMSDLAEVAAGVGGKVIAAEQAGFDGDAMEAEAWGYLAVRSLLSLPLTYPQTTGCEMPVTGGVLAPKPNTKI